MKCHCGNECMFCPDGHLIETEHWCTLCKFASCPLCCDCSQACIGNGYVHVGEPNWWWGVG